MFSSDKFMVWAFGCLWRDCRQYFSTLTHVFALKFLFDVLARTHTSPEITDQMKNRAYVGEILASNHIESVSLIFLSASL